MPFLAVFVHNLSPVAFHLGDLFAVRWYGLSYLAGFLAGYWMVKLAISRGKSTLAPQAVGDMTTTLAIGAVLGGRLGYCIFYKPALLIEFIPVTIFGFKLPLWGALAIHQGGMSAHGGIIGVIAATAWFAWRNGHTFSHLIDLAAFGTPLGLFFGRLANFVNGELLGRPCDPSFPLAWKFPQEMLTWSNEQLQQLAPIVSMLKPTEIQRFGLAQATLEAIHRDQSGAILAAVEPLLTTRHPSQLYEAAMEGLVLFFFLIAVAWKPRRPLVIGSCFCLGYGVVRVICEFFRLPDAHLAKAEFETLHVTRGQWLSALLALLGLSLLIFAARRNLPEMCGLAPRKQPVTPPAK